jgi:hypothetical protein
MRGTPLAPWERRMNLLTALARDLRIAAEQVDLTTEAERGMLTALAKTMDTAAAAAARQG